MTIKVSLQSKLDNFSLNINFEGNSKRIGILGESGAGKSMLLKYLAGIYKPDSGTIYLDDDCLLDTDKKINVRPQERNIAYMFQNYALFPTMTVRNNIEIIVKGSKQEKKEKADYLLKKFHIEEIADKKPHELSGGQQQRVALARVLAYEPKLILLDEPFSAIDQLLKERLQIELEAMISDYDGTVIMVSHSREELYKFSEELIVISKGEVIDYGKTKEVFRIPKVSRSARLIGINNIMPANIEEDGKISVPEWGIKLDCEKLLPKDRLKKIKYIGIRDEDLVPVYGEIDSDEHCIEISNVNIYESIRDRKVFFSIKNKKKKSSDFGNYSFIMKNKIDGDSIYGAVPKKLKIDIDKLIFFDK